MLLPTVRALLQASTTLLGFALLHAPAAAVTPAQRGVEALRRTGPSGSLVEAPPQTGAGHGNLVERGGQRPVVLLTGYWPPTNESVRRFSQDPAKNPGGWMGSNWMGRGYDVVSYFPEFNNPNCTSCGKGFGDLEVDYQDTTADFALITTQHKPVAIMTFSRGNLDRSWEVEMNQFNRANWINDFVAPVNPTPSPPDASIRRGALRLTALPAQKIVDAIEASPLTIQPFICYTQSGGGYLSEFIAYLGVWYQARNNNPALPDWCAAAGHIHVGANVSWPEASMAVDVSLGALLDHVDRVRRTAPIIPYCEGLSNSEGFGAQLSAMGGTSLALNDLQLVVQRVPDNTAGIAFYGPTQASGPLGNGLLCVGGPFQRLPIPAVANVVGAMILPLDLSAAPLGSGTNTVTPGSTWNLQVWYRDVGVGAGTNTTNALEMTFSL